MQTTMVHSIGCPCPTKFPLAFIHNAYQMNERIHAYGTKIFLQQTSGHFVTETNTQVTNGGKFFITVFY